MTTAVVTTAVVTGAGSGIGAATVQRLRAAGVRVAALDVRGGSDPAGWDEAGLLTCDVTDEASVETAMARVLTAFGRLDVLINNAGITGSTSAGVLHETPVVEWDRVHAVNVRGPFLCSRAVLPTMIAQGAGHVITIASVAGLVAFPGRAAYTASKGAAVMLTRSIAVDYARYGIRANAICPGMVYTPMTAWRLDQPDLREAVERQIPMGRVADPAEIADAVTLLALGRLPYLNGHPLVLDVVDSCTPAHVLQRLAQTVDVEAAIDSGQLTVLDSDSTYLQGGGFLQARMIEFWADQAQWLGNTAGVVHNVGDMTWAHREKPGVQDLAVYESELNRIMDHYPQIVLCLYDLDRCDGEMVLDVLKTHPKAMLGGMIIDNPYYLEPDDFLASRTRS